MLGPITRLPWYGFIVRTLISLFGSGVITLIGSPAPIFAQCSPAGPSLTAGSTVTCSGPQTSRLGQGPGADNITVNVNNGGSITTIDQNAISLGNNVHITLGSSGPPAGGSVANPAVLIQSTTNMSATGGQYGDGDNTIDVGSNSVILINRNAQVIANGTEQTSEAINPYGPGNTIINYGLIQGGPSSAIFFQNALSGSAINTVDNFGTIQLIPVGSVNPVTGGQAVGSNGAVGIDFINETGARVIGNLDFQGGDDHVTLNPGSSITGDFDGGGGTNTLTLNASPTSADTFSGQVKDFQELDKTGGGTWTLTGAIGNNGGAIPLVVRVIGGTLVLTGNNVNFNGSLVINPGAILSTPGPDPTATLEARAQSLPPLITDHGTLLINQVSPDGIQPADGTYAGTVEGTGVLTKIGGGTLTLTGTNTYSGGTNVNVGAVAVSADNALGAATGPLTFNGGTLRFNSSFNLSPTRAITLNAANGGFAGGGTFDTNGHVSTISQGIVGAGGLVEADSSGGAGRLILTGLNTYAGGTTINAGTLQLGNGGTTGSILGNVADNGMLAFNRSDVVTFPGVVSSTGLLIQAGSGTTILTAANTYSGGTTISAGTLQLGNGGTSGSITGNVADNGALVFDRSDSVSFPGVVSSAGSVTQMGSGTTTLTGNNSYTGGTTINAGTLQLGTGGTTGSILGNVADNGTLAFNRSDVVTFPGVVSGTGLLTQAGSGTTILTAANTYTGGTTISAGTLQLGNGGTSGSVTGNVADNGTLAFDRSDSVSFPGVVSGAGSVIQAGAGTTILTANNPYTGGTAVSAGTLVIGDPANPSAALSGGGPITVASSATLGGYGSVNGSVTNNGTVTAGSATPGFGTSVAGTFTIIGNLLNQGTANLASDLIVGNVLEVQGNYIGAGGALNLNTVLASDNSPSDTLVISAGTATGDTSVHINNAGGAGAETNSNGILIVQAINGGTTAPDAFALVGEVRAGAFDYDLFRGGLNGSDPNDWFLRSSFIVQPVPPEPPVPPVQPGPLPPIPPFPSDPPPAPLPPGVYPIIGPELATDGVVQPIARQMALTMLGTLHERIGDTLTVENAGVDAEGWGRSGWARFFGQQIDNRYQAFADPSTTGRLFGVQAGFDIWRGSFVPGHRDAAGLYFAYGNAAMDVDGLTTNVAATAYVQSRTGTVNLDAYSGGAYWTHYGPGGWYLDAVVQGTAYTGNATTQFANLPTTGSGIITSLEAGYPIPLPLGPRFVLEPQGQILWQHVSFSQANDGLGAVALGSTSGVTGRLGVRGQWSIITGNGQVWQPYVRANLWQNWGGEATTTFGNDQVPLLEQSTQLEFAAGVTTKLNTCLSLYAQAGYEFAMGGTDGGRRQGVRGDFGLRLTFGNPLPPPPAPAVVPTATVARSYLVFFDWDKATLTDRARQIIREAADNSTHVQYTRIEVNGYTDTSGTPKYNQGLSVRRAESVAAELVRDGVPRNVVTIQGFGETHLLVPTGPGVREPLNRRVEIVMQ